jgi:hypothetical protein
MYEREREHDKTSADETDQMEAIYDDVSEEVNAVRLALRSLVQHRFATTPFSVFSSF